MILLRGFLSSGTEGSGLELWLAERESLPEPVLKMVLLIRTGGAGGLSSESPLSHISGWGRGGRKAHWARMDQGTAQTTIDRVAHREGARQRSHQHEAQAWSCSDLRRSPNDQQGGRGAASTPAADSDRETERYKSVNGTHMWCKVQSSEIYRKWLSHAYRRLRTLTVCKEAC